MKFHLILFLMCSCITTLLNAQKENVNITLNNGTSYRGYVINENSSEIFLKNLDGEIRLVNKDNIAHQKVKKAFYSSSISLGVNAGSARNENSLFVSMLHENTFRIYHDFRAGFVYGLEQINEATIPLGLTVKQMIPFNNQYFSVNVSYGKSYSLEDPKNLYYLSELRRHGGAFFTLEAGLSIPLTYHSSVSLAVGYRYSYLDYTYDEWNVKNIDRRYEYQRLSIRFGISLY